MDKEIVFIYSGTFFSHKKERNLAICNIIDRPQWHYAELNKSDRERQIPYNFFFIWNLKQNKLKQNQTHGYKEQISGCQRRGAGGGRNG